LHQYPSLFLKIGQSAGDNTTHEPAQQTWLFIFNFTQNGFYLYGYGQTNFYRKHLAAHGL
jgi:hypothetical protein